MLSESDVVKLLFGFKLKHLRQELGLGLEELAARSGLSKSYIHDLEKGKKYPKVDKINVLAKALEVDFDYLVSRRASKKIQPVIDLLTSDVLREFPLEDFGVSTDKLIELLANTPERVTAFISTITHMIRHFQVEREHLYFTALRSYQNLKNNYFPEIEQEVQALRTAFGIAGNLLPGIKPLEELLHQEYGIRVNREKFSQEVADLSSRSYYVAAQKTLYVRSGLSVAQERFLLSRELAFQYTQWQPRPFETRILDVPNFEVLYNNFQASYFASSLLMDEDSLVADISTWADSPQWDASFLVRLLDKYQVTPEMLLQRLSNLLPHHLGLTDLFFIRLQANTDLQEYRMTKELHLDRPQNPYANALHEHYCRRWVSVNIIKQARQTKQQDVLVEAQLSEYWQSQDTYLCLSMARPVAGTDRVYSSVTLGLLVNETLRASFRFLSDPALPRRIVNITCERCSITDCEARVRPALVLEERSKSQLLMEQLRRLGD
jgi:XRE family transcriptional regulator, fatty acid utilization regulator